MSGKCPEGFPDADAAVNASRLWGIFRNDAELK